MRNLSRRVIAALVAICVLFALFVAGIGLVGMLGVRSATDSGNQIITDEMTTLTMTAQLGRSMDLVYSTAERALLTGDTDQQTELIDQMYSQLIPQVDGQLANLLSRHADDPSAEVSDIGHFAQQWRTVRKLLATAHVPGSSSVAFAARLTAMYQPLSRHVNDLLVNEQENATDRGEVASSNSASTLRMIEGAIAFAVAICILIAWVGIRGVRRALQPEQEQGEFAETLQIAADEEEAHRLLQHHLERSLVGTNAVVLNRNNSADRLEAVTALPSGSPLAESLRGAQPESCLAVRSGRSHSESATHPSLLACSVCSICPGNSLCVPLTVGGEVIGSVLLNRDSPYKEHEDRRIRESVSQAAPVLANLRNLAVAEVRASTDALTGLSNKRAVTDTLKRMFAQAVGTQSALTLVLLDLDHFKQINDRRGHPVGDQVLASVGAVLRNALRVGDFAARNGGEEFALILPDTNVAAAYEIAERVRSAIADISLPGVDVSVSASLGVAGFPDHAATFERLEKLADAALYTAKRSGRNRTVVADPSSETQSPDEVSLNGHAERVRPTV